MTTNADNLSPQLEGLSQEIIRSIPRWRAEHGDLLYIPVRSGIVVSPITRGEAIEFELNSAADPTGAQIDLFRRCTVYPESWNDLAYGLSLKDFHSAFNALWQASGFRDQESFDSDLDQMRLLVTERDHAIIRHICLAFHGKDPDEINRLPRTRILYLLAQAEAILGVAYDGSPIDQIQESLIARARAEAKKQGLPKQARRRTFKVEDDVREISRFDRDVSDIDQTLR